MDEGFQVVHDINYGYGFRVTRKEASAWIGSSWIRMYADELGEERYSEGYMLQGLHIEKEWTAFIRGSYRTMRRYIGCPIRSGCRLCDVIIVTRKLRGGNLCPTLLEESEQ